MITTDKYILFWGENDIYSNFYPSIFVIGDNRFCWSEQAYMYQKALAFNDEETAAKILAMAPPDNKPLQCKKLGRQVKNFDPEQWRKQCELAMYYAVYHKFNQNISLKLKLLGTKDLILVEASPYDKIWGIGLAETDPSAQDETKWLGENLLGKVLMNVRDVLKDQKRINGYV